MQSTYAHIDKLKLQTRYEYETLMMRSLWQTIRLVTRDQWVLLYQNSV